MSIKKLIHLILNITTVVLTIVGLFITNNSLHPYDFVKFFTLVTNCSIIIVSLISSAYCFEYFYKKDKYKPFGNFVYMLKIATSVCSLITFLTVVCFLQYQPDMIHGWTNIIMHYMSPLLFIFIFLFFDNERKYPFLISFAGIGTLIIYMIYAIPLSNISKDIWGGAPYIFMDLSIVKWWAILIVPLFTSAGLILSFIFWLINRISFLIFTGDELRFKDEVVSKEEKALEAKVEVTPEDEKAIAAVLKEGYVGPRVYHVSHRNDKKWQVKFANGKKAIKLFDTQAEAIVFAKKLAKAQDGSIRIHSLTGRIRKEH